MQSGCRGENLDQSSGQNTVYFLGANLSHRFIKLSNKRTLSLAETVKLRITFGAWHRRDREAYIALAKLIWFEHH